MDAPEVQNTPTPQNRSNYTFWDDELRYSEKFLRTFHKQGVKIVQRFLDERSARGRGDEANFRLNLFNSNVRTMQDMLYSALPKIESSRTFEDANDDIARVASEIIERLLNRDITAHEEAYDSLLKSVLQDRLLPGLGVARVRYDFEEEEIEVAAQVDEMGNTIIEGFTDTRMVSEEAITEYYHWQDVRWGWARSFSEIPWLSYRSYHSKESVTERFGAKIAKKLNYKKQRAHTERDMSNTSDDSPRMEAEIWEIWDKISRKVYWWSEGCDKLLDKKDDPLQLENFFPSPAFMIANSTTTLYRPTADFHMCQDLYNEIDALQTRISILTTAVKAVGVYDASNEGIKRMLNEGFENDLIPVDDWAMFAEQGGIKGVVDWMPIMDIVNAIDKLRELRDDSIGLLQRISGMADVMQGGLQNQYEGVGQTQIKAQFGSVQVQSLQDNFAKFIANLMQLKAEVICKHFSPETIAKESNAQYMFDQPLVPQAIQLLKNAPMADLRIKVRPEQVAMVDYARLKVERTEFLTAMATFMQSAAPIMEIEEGSLPFMLEMLKWTMSGFKGSSEIEGVLDKAAEMAQQKAMEAAQNPPPDPEAAKAEADAQREQAKLQGELQKIAAKTQSDMAIRRQDAESDMQTLMMTSQAKQGEIGATHHARMKEIQFKFSTDMQREQAKLEGDLAQINTAAEAEMGKKDIEADIDIQSYLDKAMIDMDKSRMESQETLEQLVASHTAKLQEIIASATAKEVEKENQFGFDLLKQDMEADDGE